MVKNPCGRPDCKYHFGDLCFRTVGDVKKWSMPNGVDQPAATHPGDSLFEFLCQSMECHPERDVFPVATPEGFSRQRRGGGGTGEREHYGWQPYWSDRDAPSVRFAYRFIFDADPHIAIRLKLLRDVIGPQIEDVRAGVQHLGCVHIHHEPPFKALVQAWLDEEGLDLIDIKVERLNECRVLADSAQMNRWVVYHAHNTTLTALTEAEHHARHREMKQ